MLELNKEYTYKEIIETLGWTLFTGGCSKKAQIKEIEDAYEFYHPMNKKTHKEKKSYIFTKQLRELVEPSKSNCGGSHNTKNIKPMIEYLQCRLSDDFCDGEYYSMTSWLCEILDLLDKELCNTVYCGDDAIIAYCEKHNIHNRRLLEDYVSEARRILKGIFLKALENMEKKDLCEYYNGYIFIYQMSKKIGYFATHTINDLIIANETAICNDLNEEHHLSDVMKGRQLLRQIYSRMDLTEAFDEFKILELMGDDEAIKHLNKVMECEYGCSYTPIDLDHPLINYYGGVAIPDMEFVDGNTDALAKEICTIVRDKTRKAILSKGGKNKQTNERYYIYNEFEHGAEMEHIASLLFIPTIESANAISDDEWEELDALFGVSPFGNDICDPADEGAKVVLSEDEAWELFA